MSPIDVKLMKKNNDNNNKKEKKTIKWFLDISIWVNCKVEIQLFRTLLEGAIGVVLKKVVYKKNFS